MKEILQNYGGLILFYFIIIVGLCALSSKPMVNRINSDYQNYTSIKK